MQLGGPLSPPSKSIVRPTVSEWRRPPYRSGAQETSLPHQGCVSSPVDTRREEAFWIAESILERTVRSVDLVKLSDSATAPTESVRSMLSTGANQSERLQSRD